MDSQTPHANEPERVKFSDRLLAYLWDTGGFWVVTGLLSLAIVIPIGLFRDWLSLNTSHLILTGAISTVISFILWLLRDGYHDPEGTGFGKSFRGIYVLDTATQKQCSYFRSLLRNAVYTVFAIIPLIYAVDVIRLGFLRKRKSLVDILCGTQLVYKRQFAAP
jgi:uncharacterized RDD family membrane protein YckC